MNMRGVSLLATVTALFALPACKGEPPRELRLELPELITSKEPVLIQARAVQADGTSGAPKSDDQFPSIPEEWRRVVKRHGQPLDAESLVEKVWDSEMTTDGGI